MICRGEGSLDMRYSLPGDIDARPVTLIGAGTLGRRIATSFAAGGSDVRLFDLSGEQREAALDVVTGRVGDVAKFLDLHPDRPGTVTVHDDQVDAVNGAWMVIEAVPERVDLKHTVLHALDAAMPADAILASNSSSLPTSLFAEDVLRPERLLNTHYYQPPELNSVELMSCGQTDPGVIDALVERLPRYGLVPFRMRRESDGFIFNRIWAAIKRECLMVVEEGVASSEDVDRMWQIFTSAGIPPFRLMDRVGLDVVRDIEQHYAEVRPGLPEGPRRLLTRMIDRGELGVKSGRGFYDYENANGDTGN